MSEAVERSYAGLPDMAAPGTATSPRRRSVADDLGWDVLLVAVAAYILTAVARLHLLFPVLDVLQLTAVAGGGALVLYAINHHPSRTLSALGSSTTVLLAVFTLWMALTVPLGLRQYRGGMFLVNDFLKTVLLYLLIVGCVRGFKDVERLVFVYFAGAVVYAGATLMQFNLGDSWRLGSLITYDANDFAVFVASAVPLGVYFLGDAGRSVGTKILIGAGLVTMGVAFVQSGSRGGFVAMAAVAVFLVVRHRAVPLRWRIGGVGLAVLAVATFASQAYWNQMTTILNPSQDYNFTAETGRIQIWKRGLGYLWDHPVFGVGPSNFEVAEGVLSPLAFRQDYGIGVPWTAPHNSFLQVAVELGIPGLLIFLALLASVFVALGRIEIFHGRKGEPRRTGRDEDRRGNRAGLAQALMGALVAFLVGAVFLSLAYSAMLFALLALSAALWKTNGMGPRRSAGHSRGRPRHRLEETGDGETRFPL